MLNSIPGTVLFGSNIPDYVGRQTYLGEPPYGMNVFYAWQFPGGKGDGVRIVLIDRNGCNTNHLDLTGNVSEAYFSDGHHATAVAGIMVAKDNGFGITGFAPNAVVHVIDAGNNDDISQEITEAKTWLEGNGGGPGDIIVIEIQVDGNYNGVTYTEMPAEFLPTNYNSEPNRESIKQVVDQGFIVIEVAGNGNTNLDRNNLDKLMPIDYTGAIMVAAMTENGRYRAGNSNYGKRIDANGWGQNIVTTGFGDLYKGDGINEYYTETFGGTSGATPMVAGVAAILQGIYRHYTGNSLTSREIKNMLRNQGPGGDLYPNWGYRPDQFILNPNYPNPFARGITS